MILRSVSPCTNWLIILLLAMPVIATDPKLSYPPTRTEKMSEKLHGVAIADPYRWLEDANSPEVMAWVEKQNQATRAFLDKLPGRDKIRKQLNALLDIGSISPPAPARKHYFYTRREGKQNQPILYVRDGVQSKDRVLLDPNSMAADGTVALDWWFPSPDGSLLAYGISANGSEQSVLHVRNVSTGADLPDVIERARYASVAWLPDSKGFYYTRYPAVGSVPKGEENYHHHVYLHELGSEPARDPKVFGEGRPAEDMPRVELSPDGRWLVVTEHQGWAKSEIYFKDRKAVDAPFVPLIEKSNALYDITARNDRFYVHTNEKAPHYRLFQVDPLKSERKEWQEVIPEGNDVLQGVEAVGDFLAGLYMHQAASQVRLFDLNGKLVQEIKLPTLGTVEAIHGEWNGGELFFGFQSYTVPPTVFRVDLKTQQQEVWQKIESNFDTSQYEVEQVHYPSKDGTEVSLFLAHRKGLKPNGHNPTVLYGYGGFNISLTPNFDIRRNLFTGFLDHGGLLAVANLRGGGEYGEDWHQAGMLGNKQNVFDDFIAAAEWLIKENYTDRDHLAIRGGSNGGLLTGAALTQRPDLFKAVVCQVPLLDMVRYHKFLIARLWIPEYGSADDPEQFKWLYAYSPYHHVRPTNYPAVLLTAAESDSRVDALHARKMAARLQATTTSSNPILLRLETKAGHGAGKPRGKVLDELTDVWSFIFSQLGIGI